jgi:hypothetical protein
MNVVDLKHPRMRDVTQVHETSPIMFDVYERDLSFSGTRTGSYKVESHKAIVRMLDGEPRAIGIVGKGFQVLKTKQLCESIHNDVVSTLTDEQRDGMKILDNASYHGAHCFRQYVFPNMKCEINDKSHSMFRIVLRNSYDGSSTFKLYSGAIDAFCWNGMVRGEYDGIVRRHTKGLTIPSVTERIQRSVKVYYEEASTWRRWAGKKISDDDARQCFAAIPGISERRLEQLFRQFHIEALVHGRTVWALYSAATYYASHNEGDFKVRQTGQDSQATTLMHREHQVMKWVDGVEFERLAA